MKAPCPECREVHASDWVIAVERFSPESRRFIANPNYVTDAQLRASRAEAIADVCRARSATP